MVSVRNWENKKVEIFAKLEGFNPGGSIKDRIGKAMLEEAERNGDLAWDKIILEASSGNTGIALAMIGAVKGYRVTIVIPENASIERLQILKAYGAEVIFTDKSFGVDGSITKVKELLRANPEKYFSPDQYSNVHNPRSHYETTARELIWQMGGKFDYFVAGVGTGGTVTGIGRALKEMVPGVRVIAVQPQRNHKVQGLKNLEESIVPKVYSSNYVDETIIVNNEDAFSSARRLASEQGLLVGMSSGAAMYGALQVSKRMNGGRIAAIFPDRGDRYLSTGLFGV
jgi:cysteine synthase B